MTSSRLLVTNVSRGCNYVAPWQRRGRSARRITPCAGESRAHHAPVQTYANGLSTGVNWNELATKQNASSLSYYYTTFHQLLLLTSLASTTKTNLAVRPYSSHPFRPVQGVSVASKASDWQSEIRIQKLAQERTWNRLKGRITILYALCSHSMPRGRCWLPHSMLWFCVLYLEIT